MKRWISNLFSPRSLAKDVVEGRRERRSNAIEEREWRRRIVLASRKIQGVHHELTEDIADVRGLKTHLDNARPEMQRLEEALAESRAVFAALQEQLHDHSMLLTKQFEFLDPKLAGNATAVPMPHVLPATATPEPVPDVAPSVESAPVEVVVPDDIPIESEPSAHELAQDVRIAELELELRGLESVRADLAQVSAELEQARTAGDERAARLEQRLTEAHDERAHLVLEHEKSLVETSKELLAQVVELRHEAKLQKDERDRMAVELAEAKSRADARIAELEAALLAAGDYSRAEEERRDALEQASQSFELQIDEMHALVEGIEQKREAVERSAAKELAESAARVLELEAYCRDLEEKQRSSDAVARDSREIETRFEARVAEVKTAYEEQINSIRERLRQSEIARLEIETRATQEMTDFADHSRSRLQQLTTELKAREQRVESLEFEVDELQRRNSALEKAASGLNELRDEVRASNEELEAKTARLLELVRGTSEPRPVEDLPADAVRIDVERIDVDEPQPPFPSRVDDRVVEEYDPTELDGR